MVMKQARIADLKARLSEYLRSVRRGETVIVLDRETPVAKLVPYPSGASSLTIRKPAPGAPSLHRVVLPPPLRVGVDVVALLLEERQAER
jgi:prevent-host-death family protein